MESMDEQASLGDFSFASESYPLDSPGVLDLRRLTSFSTDSLKTPFGNDDTRADDDDKSAQDETPSHEGAPAVTRHLASSQKVTKNIPFAHLVGPWANAPDSPGLGLQDASTTESLTSKASANSVTTDSNAPPSPGKPRPSSATRRSLFRKISPEPVSQRASSATTRPGSGKQRPTSATAKARAARTRPDSAKSAVVANGDEELLSSANIAAARYYAGLGEKKNFTRALSWEREKEPLSQTLPVGDQKAAPRSVPGWTTPRLQHLRHPKPQREMMEVIETSAGKGAFRISGFSQRLIQTEKNPNKSLLQTVLERGGGSALSFGEDGDIRRDENKARGRESTKVVGMGQCKARDSVHAKKSQESEGRTRTSKVSNASNENKCPVDGWRQETGVGWDAISSKYPYYKRVNEGKERDGEQVGLQILPLRVAGPKTQSHCYVFERSNRLFNSGFMSQAYNAKKVRIQRRPLSAQLRDDIASPPAETTKRGAITVAELDRQLRLLEIQAKAAETGGPPLRIPALNMGEVDHADGTNVFGHTRQVFSAGGGNERSRRWHMSPPLASPRRGALTPSHVGLELSRGSLNIRGLNYEDELAPFEIWSFQGKYQAYRRPDVDDLSTGLLGEVGKEDDIIQPRHTLRVRALNQAPAHNVLKGTGGVASFVNTKEADQSIFLKGTAVFHKEKDTGHFLSAQEINLAYSFSGRTGEPISAPGSLIAASREADHQFDSRRGGMIEGPLLQQLEQHSHAMRAFLWSVLDDMDIPGYENAEPFIKAWEGGTLDNEKFDDQEKETDIGDASSAIKAIPRDARMQICQDVWTSLTDKNVFIGPGVLNHFIPDLMPDSLQYDGGKIVISLLRLILDRSVLCWWQDDPVVQQFSKDYTEASEQAMNEVGHNPEIQFEMNCRMKENILVRAMVMPSYFVALMTSNLWPLPQLHVNIADEDRMWMQTNLLLKMYLVKRDLESRADLHKGPSIQDAYWSTNEDTRKTNEVSLYGILKEEDEDNADEVNGREGRSSRGRVHRHIAWSGVPEEDLIQEL